MNDDNTQGVFPSRSQMHRPEDAPKQQGLLRFLREVVIVLLLAAVLSTLIRFFVVQVYSIPSQSMTTTLEVGDRIAVNRLPVLGKQVERGDVVVFSDDNHWLAPSGDEGSVWTTVGQFMGIVPANGEEVLVKRVIGVGGDTISCCTAEGQLEVNGVPVDEEYVGDGIAPGDRSFTVEVPQGTYWVMGDNRSNSADSLYHLDEGEAAFITEDAVLGKVWGVIWPFNHWRGVSSRDTFTDVP